MSSELRALLQSAALADPNTIKASAKAIVDAASIWNAVNGGTPLSAEERERLVRVIQSDPSLTASLFGITTDPLH